MAKKQLSKEELLLKFGAKVQEVRKKKDMSANQLAQYTGMTRHAISRLENGGTNMSLDGINRLCYALGISMETFFKGFK